MKCPFIIGKKVYLRPLLREDLTENYLKWINDQEITSFMETGIFPSTLENLTSFYESVQSSNKDVILAIIYKKTDKHIGNARLGPINWVHRKSYFGIMIGDKSIWGKGIGTEVTELILDYAFNRLNLNKVSLGVAVDNKKAIRSYKKAGFQEEGRLKEELFWNGKYIDTIYMGITRKQFTKREK